jgi:hypothetical protein
MLVNIVVEEIFILSHKVGRAGGIIIRAKKGIELGVGLKGLSNPGEGIGMNFAIGVNEVKIFAPGEPGP